MASPPLSIGLTSYNYGRYIGNAIDSILSQSFGDFELLIIDNASTDDTIDIVKSYNDPRIRLIQNAKNMGPHYSGNFYLQNAESDHMHLFCADDVMLPGCLKAQMELITSMPGVALVSCDMVVCDDNLLPIKRENLYPGIATRDEILKFCADNLCNKIGGPSNFLFPASLGRKIKIDHNLSYISDLDFGLRLLEFGVYANTGQCGYMYRRHSSSDTNLLLGTPGLEANDWAYFLDKFDQINFRNSLKLPKHFSNQDSENAMKLWRRKNRWNLKGRAKAAALNLFERALNAEKRF